MPNSYAYTIVRRLILVGLTSQAALWLPLVTLAASETVDPSASPEGARP